MTAITNESGMGEPPSIKKRGASKKKGALLEKLAPIVDGVNEAKVFRSCLDNPLHVTFRDRRKMEVTLKATAGHVASGGLGKDGPLGVMRRIVRSLEELVRPFSQ